MTYILVAVTAWLVGRLFTPICTDSYVVSQRGLLYVLRVPVVDIFASFLSVLLSEMLHFVVVILVLLGLPVGLRVD